MLNSSGVWASATTCAGSARRGRRRSKADAEAGADLFRVEVDAGDPVAYRRTLEALAA